VRFILSEVGVHAGYFADVRSALTVLGQQSVIEVQRPFSEVKAAFENAAIAIVPSKWPEPFGRTALEAHAGGAALITSATGGLAEISADAAVRLSAVSPQAIAEAASTLITDAALRETLVRAARERVAALFDIRTQADRLDAFCEAVAASRLRPAT
jgi:glycosyltransferase involved in cell wall biosynthesis